MGYPRDSQLRKVRAAEKVLSPQSLTGAEVQDLVRRVLRSRWFRNATNQVRTSPSQFGIVVSDTSWCNAEQKGLVIRVPNKSNVGVVHSLTHLVVPPDTTHAWHSPDWCRAYLDMAARFLDSTQSAFAQNPEPSVALREAFKVQKVKLRTMSPEAREAARQRALNRKGDALEDDLRAMLERLASRSREE